MARRLIASSPVSHPTLDRQGTASSSDLPLPDEQLRWRVTGYKPSDEEFLSQGRSSIADLERALQTVGRPLSSFARVLDFGSGCARVTRHLRDVTPAELHGCDVDPDAVAWCQANIPTAQFVCNDALPPLPYEDGYFDLVVNHSVFSHLPEDYQDAWLAELRRVVAVGGHLVLTVAGSHAFSGLLDQYRSWPADTSDIEESFYRKGFLFIADDSWSGSAFPEWYHSAFHSPTYVIEHWGEQLDVLAYLPRGALGYQDVVVLRRPAESAPPVGDAVV